MITAVVGAGTTGARVARDLAGTAGVTAVDIYSGSRDRIEQLSDALGPTVGAPHPDGPVPDVVVVTSAAAGQRPEVERWLRRGSSVVSMATSPGEVRNLLAVDPLARELGRFVAVGAAFSPGMSDLIVAYGAERMDRVDEVHVAMVGSGGAACERERRAALRSAAEEWRDGEWVTHPAGTGRELCWFPDPIGARDCVRGALSEPLLHLRLVPGLTRATARGALDRPGGWDRIRGVRPPSGAGDGEPGALRVELRGRRGGESVTAVYGVMDRPAVAAAATAAMVSVEGVRRGAVGAGSVAEVVPAAAGLADLRRRGVKVAVFDPPG